MTMKLINPTYTTPTPQHGRFAYVDDILRDKGYSERMINKILSNWDDIYGPAVELQDKIKLNGVFLGRLDPEQLKAMMPRMSLKTAKQIINDVEDWYNENYVLGRVW